jgi:hypothetical protein
MRTITKALIQSGGVLRKENTNSHKYAVRKDTRIWPMMTLIRAITRYYMNDQASALPYRR